MRSNARSLKDLPPTQRAIAIAAIAVSLVLVAAAQRDIQHRTADEVRGGKLHWRLLCLNALGALGYFAFGRKTTEDQNS